MCWIGIERSYTSGDCVPCCKECNSLLGNVPIFSIGDRAIYLIERYQTRHRQILNIANWSEGEIKELGYNLRKLIQRGLMLKSVYIAKLKNLDLRSIGHEPVPIQVEALSISKKSKRAAA